MITDAQIRYLKKIVDAEFNIDIADKCRKTNYVNARLIYSYILRGRGVGLVRIGESLNKNHATILYLVSNAPFYFKQEPELEFRYLSCKSLFENYYSPVLEYSRRELIQAYVKLDSQYEMVIKENESLIKEIVELKKIHEELGLEKNY